MTYIKKVWASDETIDVDELNHMEDGINDAHTLFDSVLTELSTIPDIEELLQKSVYDADEDGVIDSANVADTLKNGDTPKSYADIASEIDSDIATHTADASAHHAKYTDAEAQNAINIDTDHGTTASHNYRTDEEIQDVVGAMVVSGDNVTVTYNDTANTLTIASSGMSPTQAAKLDTIEEGATGDQTAAEIVSLINNSIFIIDADNLAVSGGTGLTPEQLTKFNGIETGATADQTAAEIVALINASSLVIDADNINRGNLSTIIERGFIGEVVVGDTLRIYNPRAGVIQSVTLISATQPTGTALTVDVRKNSIATTNSIFTSDAPMNLGTNALLTNGVYRVNGILDSTQATLALGDVLRVYVTQTGNTADVSVCIEVLY